MTQELNKLGKPKGGRPLASHTIETQLQRQMLVQWLQPRLDKIFNALAEKAEKGDVQAAKELLDRAWGKAPQSIDMTSGGLPLLIATNEGELKAVEQ